MSELLSEEGGVSEPSSPNLSCLPKTVFTENAIASRLLALVSTERLATPSTAAASDSVCSSSQVTPQKGTPKRVSDECCPQNNDIHNHHHHTNSRTSSSRSVNRGATNVVGSRRILAKVSLPLLSESSDYQVTTHPGDASPNNAKFLSTQSARSSPLTTLAATCRSPGSPKVVQFNLEATTVQSYDKDLSSQTDDSLLFQVSSLFILFVFFQSFRIFRVF